MMLLNCSLLLITMKQNILLSFNAMLNNHIHAKWTFEKNIIKQDTKRWIDKKTMLHHMKNKNAYFNVIANKVITSQRSNNMKFKSLCIDEKNIVNIIETLIQSSMLKKKMSKDYSWKEVILKLFKHLWNDFQEEKEKKDAFIAKNVQKLKASV